MRNWGKYFVPMLALTGALFGVWMVYQSQKKVPVPPILFAPPRSPYTHAIAGTGIVEASTGNIAIGTPFDLIITKIFVKEGDHVAAGDPLFQLDTRAFEAQLAASRAELSVAATTFADRKKQFSFYKRLKDTKAVSEQAFEQAHYALIESAKSIKVSQANIQVIKTNIERSTVRAPVDGEILQLNIHVGEIAPIIPITASQSVWKTAAEGALILMGQVSPLRIRVDIDENDAWRFQEGTSATAFVRGNSRIHFPVTFSRIVPYVIPKTAFSGATSERVDTRVLQALYLFDKGNLPIYTGQLLDVFIEAKPNEYGSNQ